MEESALLREKERERRRIRDRQRRSSMSTEQRERHLARRRRNYQLRRLRSRNNVKTSFSETSSCKPFGGETSIAELDLQQNGLTLVGFNHGQESLNPDSITSASSETLDPRAEILQGRVRLSQIRRLARSIGIHQMEESASNSMSEVHNLECDFNRSSKALRLNRVKRLARMMNSSVKPCADESQHQTTIAGTNVANNGRNRGWWIDWRRQKSGVFERKREEEDNAVDCKIIYVNTNVSSRVVLFLTESKFKILGFFGRNYGTPVVGVGFCMK